MSDNSGIGAIIGIVLLAAVAHQCSKEPSAVDATDASSGLSSAEASERASEAAATAVSGTTYADQGEPYGCTEDCSGHEAGYEWAQENEITDPDECDGNSESFIEGCRAYGEAYQQAKEEALEDAEDEN